MCKFVYLEVIVRSIYWLIRACKCARDNSCLYRQNCQGGRCRCLKQPPHHLVLAAALQFLILTVGCMRCVREIFLRPAPQSSLSFPMPFRILRCLSLCGSMPRCLETDRARVCRLLLCRILPRKNRMSLLARKRRLPLRSLRRVHYK